MPEGGTLEPRAALQRAVDCLTQGVFDGRSVDGAQANALEAIAWALVGLLQTQVQGGARPAAREGAAREAGLAQTLERAGFVALRPDGAGRLPPF